MFHSSLYTSVTNKYKWKDYLRMALKNVFFFLVLTCLLAFATATGSYDLKVNSRGHNLTERIEASDGQFIECQKALLQLKSCSNVTIQYFLTGHADISSECCSGIEASTSACSPAGFTSLGYTAQESNILSAYCTATAPAPAPSS